MGKRTNTAKWIESSKRWQIKVQKDGVRRTFNSSKPGRSGQREANAKADAWLDSSVCSSGLRVEQLAADYVESLKETTSYSHWSKEQRTLKNWLLPDVGHLKIDRLTEDHLQKILIRASKSSKSNQSAGLSKKSLQNLRASINAFVKYCRVKRKATTLYPEDLTIPKNAVRNTKNVLQPSELTALFSVSTTAFRGKTVEEPYIHAFRFQVLTGLRPGEIIGLEWGDICGRTVLIRRAVNIFGEETQGKNENANRSFVLNDLAYSELCAQQLLSSSDRVFEISTEESYRKHLRKYCETNGITCVTPYELRHTFVSAVKTLPEGEIKHLVGHSRSMDTFGVYSHALDGEQQSTAAKTQEIFSKLLHLHAV